LISSVRLAIRVQRKFRLTSSNDYMRVRRTGKSFAHPLVVLVALPNDQERVRLAVSAGRRVGKAVQRNRAKRLLREAARAFIPEISPGWDIVLVARQPLSEAGLQGAKEAIGSLLQRAGLFRDQVE
jgi:ribonuclease P protein component